MFYHIKNKIRTLSNKYKSVSKIYSFANKIKVMLFINISDETYAKLKYKENTGKILNLQHPKTFNEKLWWLKINNRDPLLTVCSDKVTVRNYVKEKGLAEILVPFYGVYDKAEDIEFDNLPEKAFIKVNHFSGKNRIWDRNKPFDREAFIKEFDKALKENYYYQSREWNYKNIKPKIIVEKILVDDPKNTLVDYRFLCFDGKVKLIFVDIETAAEDGTHYPYAKRNVYDTNFNCLDIKVKRENFERNKVKKPKNLEVMIQYAEMLSEPFVFARVDLYNIDGIIYFGEITFYPGGCTQLAEPEKFEIELGSWIDITSNKIEIKEN